MRQRGIFANTARNAKTQSLTDVSGCDGRKRTASNPTRRVWINGTYFETVPKEPRLDRALLLHMPASRVLPGPDVVLSQSQIAVVSGL